MGDARPVGEPLAAGASADYVHMHTHVYDRMCVSMYLGLGQELCCLDTWRPGFAAGVGWDCGMGGLGPILLGRTYAAMSSPNA